MHLSKRFRGARALRARFFRQTTFLRDDYGKLRMTLKRSTAKFKHGRCLESRRDAHCEHPTQIQKKCPHRRAFFSLQGAQSPATWDVAIPMSLPRLTTEEGTAESAETTLPEPQKSTARVIEWPVSVAQPSRRIRHCALRSPDARIGGGTAKGSNQTEG